MDQLVACVEDAHCDVKYITTIWILKRSETGDDKQYSLSVTLHYGLQFTLEIIEAQIEILSRRESKSDLRGYIETDKATQGQTTTSLMSEIESDLEQILVNETFVEVDIVTALKTFLHTDTNISLISFLEGYLRSIYGNNLAVDRYLDNFRSICHEAESDVEVAKYYLNLFPQHAANIDEDYEFVLQCDRELEDVEHYVESLSASEIQAILESFANEERFSDSTSISTLEPDSDEETLRPNYNVMKPKCLSSELVEYVVKHSDNYFQVYLQRIVDRLSEEFSERFLRIYLKRQLKKYSEENLDIDFDTYVGITFEADLQTYLQKAYLKDYQAYVKTSLKRDVELYIKTHLKDDFHKHMQAYVETYLKLRLMPDPNVDCDLVSDVGLLTTQSDESTSAPDISQSDNIEFSSLFKMDLVAIKPHFAYFSHFPLVGQRLEIDLTTDMTIEDIIRFQGYFSSVDRSTNPNVLLHILSAYYKETHLPLDEANESNCNILLATILFFAFIGILLGYFAR